MVLTSFRAEGEPLTPGAQLPAVQTWLPWPGAVVYYAFERRRWSMYNRVPSFAVNGMARRGAGTDQR